MQRRSIFIFAGMLAATLALADGAWKWTDANGVEHYSDVPVDGAEEINLSEYTRHRPGAAAKHRERAAHLYLVCFLRLDSGQRLTSLCRAE